VCKLLLPDSTIQWANGQTSSMGPAGGAVFPFITGALAQKVSRFAIAPRRGAEVPGSTALKSCSLCKVFCSSTTRLLIERVQ
jgi:hypothetical protein